MKEKEYQKDLHDSLGQKLLLVKNQVLINKDKKSCELVNEAINEIRIISKNLQPNQIKQIGITKSIEDLIYELDSHYSTILVFGDIDNIDHLLNPKQELNLYRIIQESLNNIIKHSKADSAQVIINETSKRVYLSIKDNGIGFNYHEKYQNPNSIGLKNLKSRVIFLKGLIRVRSIMNKGTTIEISFPKI
ncbi:sensor histidine kinase [Tenacibaculum sp. nBUS_03]|uniref:sensor histidine kinase n=1 Tax=Tenacibaculum sp. nBUS_03 TaxID=3395320 RepID=UPI003EBBF81A